MLVCNDVGAVREAYLRFSHLRARSPLARAASEHAFDLGLNSFPTLFGNPCIYLHSIPIVGLRSKLEF